MLTEVLSTQRLNLRPLVREDAEPIAAQIGKLSVARWLTNVPHPYTRKDADDFIETVDADDLPTWAICPRKDGQDVSTDPALVGVISHHKDLGYWLAEPYWGQGYMSEAARAVVAAHFYEHARTMTSGYLLGNAASARVLKKLGFEPIELVDRHVMSLGRSVALQRVQLTRNAWEATQ